MSSLNRVTVIASSVRYQVCRLRTSQALCDISRVWKSQPTGCNSQSGKCFTSSTNRHQKYQVLTGKKRKIANLGVITWFKDSEKVLIQYKWWKKVDFSQSLKSLQPLLWAQPYAHLCHVSRNRDAQYGCFPTSYELETLTKLNLFLPFIFE